jgi:hypothetical protein
MRGIAATALRNAGAVVSPNIYVTGSGRSTNGVFAEHEILIVTISCFATVNGKEYNRYITSVQAERL